VHLDSLENLRQDPVEAAVLLRDARDYFFVSGLHMLLGATPEFSGGVLSTHAQVRSVFPAPNRLDALSLPEVEELLARRLRHLRIEGMDIVPPVTRELVRRAHELFLGDLRGMLSALEDACYRALGSLRPAPLGLEQAGPVLAPLYREQLARDLTPAELSHLRRLAELGLREFRQADVVESLGLSQGRVSVLFSALERAQAILPVRTEGRSRWYALGGRARLALGA